MEGQGSQWPTPLPGYDSAEERKPETRREAAVPEENKTREKLEKKALKAQLKKQKKEAAKKDDTKA